MSNNTPKTPAQPETAPTTSQVIDMVVHMKCAIDNAVMWFGFYCEDLIRDRSNGKKETEYIAEFKSAYHVATQVLDLVTLPESVRSAFNLILEDEVLKPWFTDGELKTIKRLVQ